MRKLILVIIVLSLIGCKDTNCPAFPPSLVEYFPYTDGNELKFKNSNSDTLILIVNKNWASDSYSFEWNCKCACGADAGFETDYSEKYSLSITGTIGIGDNNFELICNFYDSTVHNDVLSYFKQGVYPYNDAQQSNLPDTIFIEKPTYNRVGNVTIIKNKGIVEFWDENQNCKWIMIE